jgi:hypothetical protein
MKKMRLNPDQLTVESFPTAEGDPSARGTVHGLGSGLGCGSAVGWNPCDPSYSADGECICGDHDVQPTEPPGCIA